MGDGPTGHLVRRAGGWIITLALAYIVFSITLGTVQRSLMYFPDPAKFEPGAWALKELLPLQVHTADNLTLTGWYAPPKQRGKLTVVFFQGNAGHLGYRNYKVRSWLDNGYGALLIGYRGFGNPGSPSEQGFYADARATINALRATGVPEKALVFYGESIGTGVAVQMATEYTPDALILESPYTSIPDVGAHRYPLVPVSYLLRDKFDSLSKIKNIHVPLLLLHGQLDRVVPARFGHALFDAANEPKQAEFVPDVGHTNVYNLHVQQLVLAFIAKLPTDALAKPALKAPEEKKN